MVHITAVANLDHEHDQPLVLDLIEHVAVATLHLVEMVSARCMPIGLSPAPWGKQDRAHKEQGRRRWHSNDAVHVGAFASCQHEIQAEA